MTRAFYDVVGDDGIAQILSGVRAKSLVTNSGKGFVRSHFVGLLKFSNSLSLRRVMAISHEPVELHVVVIGVAGDSTVLGEEHMLKVCLARDQEPQDVLGKLKSHFLLELVGWWSLVGHKWPSFAEDDVKRFFSGGPNKMLGKATELNELGVVALNLVDIVGDHFQGDRLMFGGVDLLPFKFASLRVLLQALVGNRSSIGSENEVSFEGVGHISGIHVQHGGVGTSFLESIDNVGEGGEDVIALLEIVIVANLGVQVTNGTGGGNVVLGTGDIDFLDNGSEELIFDGLDLLSHGGFVKGVAMGIVMGTSVLASEDINVGGQFIQLGVAVVEMEEAMGASLNQDP